MGNISDDPLCVDADGADDVAGTEDDDLRLLPGSPCIDAGSNGAVPVDVLTDLDGLPRFIDDPLTGDTGAGAPPVVDMGAYEYLLGDFERDGDVDLHDYGVFALCLNGPGETTPPGGCAPDEFARADVDADNDVDMEDFAAFQRAFTGSSP